MLPLLLVLILFCPTTTAFAAEPTPTPIPRKNSMAWLRVANLLPLNSSSRIDLLLNAQPWRTGLDPGFINSYSEVPAGAWSFEIVASQTKTPLATAHLDSIRPGEFATLVVMPQGSQVKALALPDRIPAHHPAPRLRIFANVSVPHLKLDLGDWGRWETVPSPFTTTLTHPTATLSMATATYTSRSGDPVRLQYPLYFDQSPAQTLFLFDSGSGRCDLRVLPDNIIPGP